METAFALYSRLDREQVLPRIQGIQKALPNLNIFIDMLSLRSGQNWEQEIRKIIPSKDIFYLFWSGNAKRSHWVEKEWRCALEMKGLDFIDPVPLVSPEIVPPPEELSAKHFDDWTLAFMRSEKSSDPPDGVK
ncbi:MAG: toll/interleukin-1 receptor domain-containing protein [Thermoplasmata archaeon]|nr:toll/interleukin-1 receptor domain-containing protein [Thermoplasmata archaeon]